MRVFKIGSPLDFVHFLEKHMLERADEAELRKLFAAHGKISDCLLMMNFQKGALFHVTTETGIMYLVEVTDLESPRIHITRHTQDGGRCRVVYLGNHSLISGRLEVGGVIQCEEITILPLQQITQLAILSS
jgi:hypothetical protein